MLKSHFKSADRATRQARASNISPLVCRVVLAATLCVLTGLTVESAVSAFEGPTSLREEANTARPQDAVGDWQEKWPQGPYVANSRIPHATALPGVKSWTIHTHPIEVASPKTFASAIHPNGSQIAILRGALVCIYDLSPLARKEFWLCSQPDVHYTDIAWQPSGEFLALARSDGVIELRPSDADGKSRELSKQTGPAKKLTWSPDSHYLAFVVGDSVRVLSTDGFEELQGPSHSNPIMDVSWRKDSQALVTLATRGLFIWELQEGRMTPHNPFLRMELVDWSPDGTKLAIYSNNGSPAIGIVNIEGTVLQTWGETSTKVPHELMWNASSGHIQTTGVRQVATIWNEDQQVVEAYQAPMGSYDTSYWSADGKTAVFVSGNGTIDTLHLPTKETTRILSQRVHSVDYALDGRHIAVGTTSGEVLLYSPDWKFQRKLLSPFIQPKRVSFSPDGTRLALFPTEIESFEVWTVDGELVHRFPGKGIVVNFYAWSPDGNHLATVSGDRRVQVWDMEGNLLHEVPHTRPMRAVTWAPHQLLASQDGHGNIKIFDLETEVIQNMKSWSAGALAWRPGTDQLLIGNSQSWVVGERETTDLQQIPSGTRPRRNLTRWSPSGKKLLWNNYAIPSISNVDEDSLTSTIIESGRPLKNIKLGSVDDAVWSHDETQLLVPSRGAIQVFDVETFDLQAVLLPLPGGEILAVSPAGAILNGTPEDYDNLILYGVERNDGQRHLFTPVEFYERFELPR